MVTDVEIDTATDLFYYMRGNEIRYFGDRYFAHKSQVACMKGEVITREDMLRVAVPKVSNLVIYGSGPTVTNIKWISKGFFRIQLTTSEGERTTKDFNAGEKEQPKAYKQAFDFLKTTLVTVFDDPPTWNWLDWKVRPVEQNNSQSHDITETDERNGIASSGFDDEVQSAPSGGDFSINDSFFDNPASELNSEDVERVGNILQLTPSPAEQGTKSRGIQFGEYRIVLDSSRIIEERIDLLNDWTEDHITVGSTKYDIMRPNDSSDERFFYITGVNKETTGLARYANLLGVVQPLSVGPAEFLDGARGIILKCNFSRPRDAIRKISKANHIPYQSEEVKKGELDRDIAKARKRWSRNGAQNIESSRFLLSRLRL